MKKSKAEAFIRGLGTTEKELRDTITCLILHREQARDERMKMLAMESQKLIDRLNDIDRKKVLEEIECFKDTLFLQKRFSLP